LLSIFKCTAAAEKLPLETLIDEFDRPSPAGFQRHSVGLRARSPALHTNLFISIYLIYLQQAIYLMLYKRQI